MLFVNEEWDNPLREQRIDGSFIRRENIPDELLNLEISDMQYIFRILTHSNILKKSGSRICFPHLDGNVSIYESGHNLSTADGLWSFIVDTKARPADGQRIVRAWNWLVQNNPHYQDCHFIPLQLYQQLVMDVQHGAATGSGRTSQQKLFTETVFQSLQPGP